MLVFFCSCNEHDRQACHMIQVMLLEPALDTRDRWGEDSAHCAHAQCLQHVQQCTRVWYPELGVRGVFAHSVTHQTGSSVFFWHRVSHVLVIFPVILFLSWSVAFWVPVSCDVSCCTCRELFMWHHWDVHSVCVHRKTCRFLHSFYYNLTIVCRRPCQEVIRWLGQWSSQVSLLIQTTHGRDFCSPVSHDLR